MTRYICDRCASSNEKPIRRLNIPANAEEPRYYSNELKEKDIDICDACLKQLREWVKPIPKVIPLESV